MITLRDVLVFLSGAILASLQVSACEDDRAPKYSEFVGEPSGDGAAPTIVRLPETTDAFQRHDCWFDDIDGFVEQCGTVTVPESPGSDTTIALGVVRVLSTSQAPQGDPVVYLDGGPGSAAIEDLNLLWPVFAPLAADRDVIFIDQRGTGVTRPLLTCTEGGAAEDALDECFARLSEASDPAAYTSADNARDIDLVRQALGYEKWNLLGISYGTRLALTIMRDFPAGVRAVVLDAVVPLEVDVLANLGRNGQAGFETAFASCAADEACAEKYPDPMAQLRRVAGSLDENPEQFGTFELSGDEFVMVLFNLMYSPVALSYVPYLIDQADQRDFTLFQQLGGAVSGAQFSFGMHLSVQCAEEFAFTSADRIAAADVEVFPELVAGLTGSEYVDYCEHWPVPAAADIENQAVQSDIPALVFAGSYDPVTPPAYSELVDEGLADSQYFLIENESHGSSVGDCGMSIVRSFLTMPSVAAQPSCLEELPALEFEGQLRPSRRRVLGRRLKMATEAPSEAELTEAVNDLRRRVLL